ncbi:MAG: hypothetical protein J6S51_00265 [Kiritimatiellae bacterium]|nr:hypothetical protein [Kiritimatiellia bacterium]
MAVGARFDINKAREEARQAESSKKQKAIISYCILGVIIIALLVAGKFGFDAFTARKARLEEEARQAERIEQQRLKKQKELREKQLAEREAEREAKRKEQELQRERDRKAREEERARRLAEQERIRREREEKRIADRQAEELKRELKRYCDDALRQVSFKAAEHVSIEKSIDRNFDFDCEDPRWLELWKAASSRSALVFFDLIAIQDEKRVGDYPSRESIQEKIEKLKQMTFMMNVMKVENKGRPEARASVYKVDPENGLVAPTEENTLKEGDLVKGWRVPFSYSGDKEIFIMTERKATRLQKEWDTKIREIKRIAKKASSPRETYRSMREKYAKEFLDFVRVQISLNEPEDVEANAQKRAGTSEALDKRAERLRQMKSGRTSSRNSSSDNTKRLGR